MKTDLRMGSSYKQNGGENIDEDSKKAFHFLESLFFFSQFTIIFPLSNSEQRRFHSAVFTSAIFR